MSEKTKVPAGTTVYRGEPDELLLDLDTESAVKHFVRALQRLNEPIRSLRIWKSRRKGVHAVVRLWRELGIHEQLFLQLFLGSDPWREMHNYEGSSTYIPHHLGNVLFKPVKREEGWSE